MTVTKDSENIPCFNFEINSEKFNIHILFKIFIDFLIIAVKLKYLLYKWLNVSVL